MDEPDIWFFACLLLWIVFFPIYITKQDQQPDASGETFHEAAKNW